MALNVCEICEHRNCICEGRTRPQEQDEDEE